MAFWFWAAPAPGTATGTAANPLLATLIWLIPFVLLMWFMVFRPQRKQQEAHRRMVAALKKGDRIVTIGGMIGEIVEISEDETRVRIADKVEVKFLKSAISRVLKG